MHVDLVDSENYLLNSCQDFSATYMAVSRLEYDLNKNASLASSKTIDALYNVILKKRPRAPETVLFFIQKSGKNPPFSCVRL